MILFFLFCVSVTADAFAYLGPGVGGGVIIATVGIIVAFLAALFGFIWFPLKRLIKKSKNKANKQKDKIG